LFGSVLEVAEGNGIAVDSDHRRTLTAIYGAHWNSDLCELLCGQQRNEFMMYNVINRLGFLSTTRCNISAELEFVASHFDDFSWRGNGLKVLSFLMIYEILGHGSLRLETEERLLDFINEGIETGGKVFGLLEFVRLEHWSTEVMNDFVGVLSEHFDKSCMSVQILWLRWMARGRLSGLTWIAC
jgi:hypothetical protein